MSEQKTKWIEYTTLAEQVTIANNELKRMICTALRDIRLDKIDEEKCPLLFAACKVAGIDEQKLSEWLYLQAYTVTQVQTLMDEYRGIEMDKVSEIIAEMGPALIFYLADDNDYLNGTVTKYDFDSYDEANACKTPVFEYKQTENVRWADWVEQQTQILKSYAWYAIDDIRFKAIPHENVIEFFAACKKCRISKFEVSGMLEDERERFPLNKAAVKDRLQMYTDMLAVDDNRIFDSVSGALIFRLADDNDYLKKIGPTETDEALNYRWLTQVHCQKERK